jgi:hypothetical protein
MTRRPAGVPQEHLRQPVTRPLTLTVDVANRQSEKEVAADSGTHSSRLGLASTDASQHLLRDPVLGDHRIVIAHPTSFTLHEVTPHAFRRGPDQRLYQSEH